MTLIPVSSISTRGSSSLKGGGSRWIGQWSSASTRSTSSGCPSTLYTWPSTCCPTGTRIGCPVFRTGAPRTRPSVGFMATARTVKSPMCWATSHTIVEVSSSSVRSTSSAELISGSSSGGKSTSTTGPITRITRPCDRPPPFSSVISRLPSVGSLAGSRAQCFGAADDLHDLGGDLRLPGLVRPPRVHLDQLLGVLGRRAHRPAPGGVLGRRRLQQRVVHPGLHVSREQRGEQGVGIRLEHVLGGRPAIGRAVHGLEHHGHEPSRPRVLAPHR